MGIDMAMSASSVRCQAPEVTLAAAMSWAPRCGISRVEDISHLGGLYIPVYASTRPAAIVDTTTYGKGLTHLDAQVGAYMEAVEFAVAENARQQSDLFYPGCARDLPGGRQDPSAALDFCPLLNHRLNPDAPMPLTRGEDLHSGQTASLPAELVVLGGTPDGSPSVFGGGSNGLASGNSLDEASLHALTELVERDIWSFQLISENSRQLDLSSLPPLVRPLQDRIENAGLNLGLRWVDNPYGVAFFAAYLWDPHRICQKFYNAGWGCHSSKPIALVRAICEAAQSRAAILHGGRSFKLSDAPDPELAKQISRRFAPRKQVHYGDLPDTPPRGTLDKQLSDLLARVHEVTERPVYRVALTPADSPLQVVRLVAPRLESCKPGQVRVGPRLKKLLDKKTQNRPAAVPA